MIALQFKTTNSSDWNTTDKTLHRLNGKPGSQIWYTNGQKMYEHYYENNQLHRLNGKPAYQTWYPNGQKMSEEYYEHGELIK